MGFGAGHVASGSLGRRGLGRLGATRGASNASGENEGLGASGKRHLGAVGLGSRNLGSVEHDGEVVHEQAFRGHRAKGAGGIDRHGDGEGEIEVSGAKRRDAVDGGKATGDHGVDLTDVVGHFFIDVLNVFFCLLKGAVQAVVEVGFGDGHALGTASGDGIAIEAAIRRIDPVFFAGAIGIGTSGIVTLLGLVDGNDLAVALGSPITGREVAGGGAEDIGEDDFSRFDLGRTVVEDGLCIGDSDRDALLFGRNNTATGIAVASRAGFATASGHEEGADGKQTGDVNLFHSFFPLLLNSPINIGRWVSKSNGGQRFFAHFPSFFAGIKEARRTLIWHWAAKKRLVSQALLAVFP